MTDDIPVEASEQQPPPENPASVLAACRVQQELSLESVASSLKLTKRMLQTLENGDFDSLPGDTFTRGYIRSYARLLGLDPNRLALDYDRLRGIETRERKVSDISKVENVRGGHMLLKVSTLAVVLAILLSLFFWWREHQPTSLSERAGYPQDSLLQDNEDIAVDALNLPEPLQRINGERLVTEPLGTDISAEPELAVDESALEADLPSAPETDNVDRATETGASEQSAAGAGNRLQISFSADCWVQVSSLGGQVLHSELMRAGQSLDLQHDSGMALVLGAAEAVASARFNGEDIQLTRNGQQSGVVRIRLGE
ncbi:MAG: helix-turn-helix domain-containing protein [Pseudomonadaceae bacterium]|nr:MAG: helix-turn-helix domain-containing protein [Pseudomonadaceae bacterium]